MTGGAIDLDLILSMDINDLLNPASTSDSTSSVANSGLNPSGSNSPSGGQSPEEFNALKKGLIDKLSGQYAYNDAVPSRGFSLYSKNFHSDFIIERDTAEAKFLHTCVLNYFNDGRYLVNKVGGMDSLVSLRDRRTVPVNLGILNAVRSTKDL